MTGRQLAYVVIRLWAVIIIVGGCLNFLAAGLPLYPGVDIGAGQAAFRMTILWNLMSVALSIVIGIVCFVIADRLAAIIAPDDGEIAIPQGSRFEVAVFGALGAYFLVMGLREAAMAIYRIVTFAPAMSASPIETLDARSMQILLGGIVQIVAGALLFFGRFGLSRMWAKTRGMQSEEDAAE